MKTGNLSTEKKIPTNKLFEKSGDGNKSNPTTKPVIIEIYAFFSLKVLL